MPVSRAGSRVGPLDRGEADVTAIDHPRVSVALPVHNCERYVAEAIESILAQTFTDFEFLIVDDGSTDGTLPILHRFAARDSRIRVISRPNTGIVGALNEMLGLARADLVARMDADDVALPVRFERQVRFLDEHPECVMVGSRVTIIDPDGDALTEMGDALSHEQIVTDLLNYKGQMVYHPAVIYRRKAVLDLGGYRPKCREAEDLDLFLRLAEIGQIVNLPEPLLRYREHRAKAGISRSNEQGYRTRVIIEEARKRHNLGPVPEHVSSQASLSGDPSQVYQTWAWWALMSGHIATARKHALACIRRAPLSLSTWRLVYCALRGH